MGLLPAVGAFEERSLKGGRGKCLKKRNRLEDPQLLVRLPDGVQEPDPLQVANQENEVPLSAT